jgi:hypothetical protein
MHIATSHAASRASARTVHLTALVAALIALAAPLNAQNGGKTFLPPPAATVSTIPQNGDVNPYGTAFAPLFNDDRSHSIENSVLQPGDLLISNFNNNQNLQGTGTTIVRVDAHGQQTLFFQGSTQYAGLSAALGVLSDGTVLAGNLKTLDGTSGTASAGAIQIISPSGMLLNVITNPAIDGPWGMAINERDRSVDVFISNVLNGTIARLTFRHERGVLSLEKSTVIATGLNHRGDPAALELGPSGLLYSAWNDTLYFASSTDNAIYRIEHASTVGASEAVPTLLLQDDVHLHGPIDMALTPDGHLLVANSDGSNVDPNQPSEIVEYTADGTFVAQFPVDPNNGGAFGIATQPVGGATRLAAVDDNTVTVTIYTELSR